MKKNNFILCIIAMAMLPFVDSCRPPSDVATNSKESKDTQKPSISLGGVGEGSKFRIGEKIEAKLMFSDNEGLSSWKMDINPTSGDAVAEKKKKWENVLKDLNGNISGKEVTLNKTIDVPDGVELGKYQIIVYLTDLFGNKNSKSLGMEIVGEDGRDENGMDENGYDEWGFDKNGIHRGTGKNYDCFGFYRDGTNKDTGTKYDEYWYDREGYDSKGFDENYIHRKTGTKYDERGYNKWGCDENCYDENEVVCGPLPLCDAELPKPPRKRYCSQ